MNRNSSLRHILVVLVVALAIGMPIWVHGDVVFTESEREAIFELSPLDTSRLKDPTNRYCGNKNAAEFGQKLFFDKRLSRTGTASCASCHEPSSDWSGGNVTGKKPRSGRIAPTLTNVGLNRWYNWDGSADSLWSQCIAPIEGAEEFAGTRVELAHTIQREPDLRADYEALFGPIPEIIAPEHLPPQGRPVPMRKRDSDNRYWMSMSEDQRHAVDELLVNTCKAIAAFEGSLISNKSPFDRFVEGLRTDDPKLLSALTAEAKTGLKIFLGKGQCVLCHSGPNFTDGEFHAVGITSRGRRDLGRWRGVEIVRKSTFNALGPYSDAEEGKFFPWVQYATRIAESKYQYKTPTLRNASLRRRFMHDGRFVSMEQVIRHYEDIDDDRKFGHVEPVLRSLRLTNTERKALIAFIGSLTDPAESVLLAQDN